MTDKKERKTNSTNGAKKNGSTVEHESSAVSSLSSKGDLKTYLMAIRDKMSDDAAAPIYALTAMNYVLSLPDIYDLLDKTNKEIARDIWLRLKQAGVQQRNPSLLFSAEEGTEAI